jgi:hypothetical protein
VRFVSQVGRFEINFGFSSMQLEELCWVSALKRDAISLDDSSKNIFQPDSLFSRKSLFSCRLSAFVTKFMAAPDRGQSGKKGKQEEIH